MTCVYVGENKLVKYYMSDASRFAWSNKIQNNQNITLFQYVEFESGPVGNGWKTESEVGYSDVTTFIVPADGTYILTYKLDVKSGGGVVFPPTDISTVLTMNGVEVPGSCALVEGQDIYTISNAVLVKFSKGDRVSLLFWSSDPDTQLGDPSLVTGILPSDEIPTEATACIVFTRLSEK